MILLDTNVVSAMMRLDQEPAVDAWLRSVSRERLLTSAPTIFELRHGIESRPLGQRRRRLQAAFVHVTTVALENRIIPFETDAAVEAGRIHAMQRARGRKTSVPDSQIAGIALTRKLQVATGDIDDFNGLGLDLINPWAPVP